MSLNSIGIGDKAPAEVNVIIEIPQKGEPVKYEVDKETGALFVDRFLTAPMFYPANYGYVPNTLSEDGDPVELGQQCGDLARRYPHMDIWGGCCGTWDNHLDEIAKNIAAQ